MAADTEGHGHASTDTTDAATKCIQSELGSREIRCSTEPHDREQRRFNVTGGDQVAGSHT